MEIRLAEEVGKMPNLSMDYLAGRENAKELFEQKIAGEFHLLLLLLSTSYCSLIYSA